MMKAEKSCWTCKHRKIGCDKTLPECNNCLRTNRKCGGFGIKLVWPEKYDGRRKPSIPAASGHLIQRGQEVFPSLAVDFLNTTFQDIALSNQYLVAESSTHMPLLSLNTRTLPAVSNPNFTLDDGRLISYFEGKLARIITTVDDARNGFRNELLPMALSQQTKAAQSLLESILALCAFHVSGPSHALRHKARALRLLNESLQTEMEGDSSAKLAACMILCVYGVFDTTDGMWMIHLRGARSLMGSVLSSDGTDKTRHEVSPFLRSWVLYHDVLGQFSQLKRDKQNDNLVNLPLSSEEKTIIVGSLGCSEELMELVACTNQLRGQARHDQNIVDQIQDRLENLSQTIVVQAEKDAPSAQIDEVRIQRTAEFYHVAALIYFRRQILRVSSLSRLIQALVESALRLIAAMEICTSPWPLFVVACEVRSDEQRLQILRTYKEMEVARRIDNIMVTRTIVEALWKQQDLALDENSRASIDWRDMVSMDEMTPSFI
ncbi:uncharacterized protein PV06_01861 [Exophiala oligosperma]|uniref:Zn(2)-C6 fungal-type domain-containing protein n=1 Tax=Exophiala oligosperma TaxID=215243 RepID=A0A0D2EE17_9EURO|nr:uncharacterized protein PV06_01861 [Exophiala oligosperma]KIW46174.1 hypothetical protein PV06_01861 [Exophiala oligosperma]